MSHATGVIQIRSNLSKKLMQKWNFFGGLMVWWFLTHPSPGVPCQKGRAGQLQMNLNPVSHLIIAFFAILTSPEGHTAPFGSRCAGVSQRGFWSQLYYTVPSAKWMHGKWGEGGRIELFFLFVWFLGGGGEGSVIACETVSDKPCRCLEKTWSVPIVPYKAQAPTWWQVIGIVSGMRGDNGRAVHAGMWLQTSFWTDKRAPLWSGWCMSVSACEYLDSSSPAWLVWLKYLQFPRRISYYSKVSSALGLGRRKHVFTSTYNNHFSLTLSIIVILQPCSKSHTSVSIAPGSTFQCSALILWAVHSSQRGWCYPKWCTDPFPFFFFFNHLFFYYY